MNIELGEYEKNVNKQHFKYIAYRKAAHSVNDYDKPIKSIDEAKKLVF
jgi:DNA polymerase/3'-5' exonuclease PolX